eukprot:9466489-Pyramimonas_sp.AAC.1
MYTTNGKSDNGFVLSRGRLRSLHRASTVLVNRKAAAAALSTNPGHNCELQPCQQQTLSPPISSQHDLPPARPALG